MMIVNDVEKFGAFRHSEYRFIKALRLSRDVGPEGCSPYVVEIILTRAVRAADEDMRLRCIGVVDIKIGKLDGMCGMLLEIEDIRDRGLEGIAFRVSEQENDAFAFSCEEFRLDLVR